MAVGCSGLESATFQPCSILRQIKFLSFHSVKASVDHMTFVRVPSSNLICLLFEIVLNLISSDDGNNGYFMSAELNLSGEN